MNLFDEATHEILLKFLDRKAREAEKEISSKGTLSETHALPLILKSRFNHIAHLDSELTAFREQVDQRFEQGDKRLGQVDRRFGRLERDLFAGFAFLGSLITIYRFIH